MKKQISFSSIQALYKEFTFKNSGHFYWSPLEQVIYYNKFDTSEVGIWSLLHELSHAILGHTTFQTDIELLMMESEAWDKARAVVDAHGLDVVIDEDHVQDCLDTYRDWLHARSTCPQCSLVGLQVNTSVYTCINCLQQWKISSSRFKRPYRLCLEQQ